ncbi:MAG: sigma-E processing peptidase SpoIIGA [Ruminococcus sp.]|nr:sigma-E processing peptidase SpoIIGA [Ruminococcus sp.]
MYIYVDILIITNIYMDFLLIQAARVITHSPMKTVRGLTAAGIGSLFSLTIFLPRLGFAALSLIKLLSSALIVWTAFGFDNMRAYIKRLFVFFLSAFIFGGVGTFVSCCMGGKTIISRNGVIYADFSLPALVVTSISAYVCIAVYKHFADCAEEGTVYTVIVSDKGRTVSFKAMADTGNILKDGFTGKPVIMCPKAFLEELYGSVPDETGIISRKGGTATLARWRLIPYSTVSSSGLTAIIRPEEICIKNEATGRLYRADAYLAAAGKDADFAVFHPKILL